MSKEMAANALYKTLCQTLNNMGWKYSREEEKFIVRTSAVGDTPKNGMDIKIMIKIDAEREVMYLKSPMQFEIPAHARDTIGKAVILANYSMLNGSFEFDFSDGYLAFKMVVPYMDSIISEAVCKYMIILSCSMTDKFNDKFQALAEARMTIDEFAKFAK